VILGDLLGALDHPALSSHRPVMAPDAQSVRVSGIAYDSRRAGAGAIFVALRGQQADGAAFAPQAIARGAVLVVAEGPPAADAVVPWVVVKDARLALALLADRFFGHPSGDLSVVGITGTNGKTTTAYLLRSIFEAAGRPCGLLGTVTYSIRGEERDATRTTPEAPDTQAMLREMVDRGCSAAVMEVSSHALAQRRVDGTRFAAGVFTNLTRDHLDFHGDMESYAAAKRRLFELLPADAPAIVNADDPRGAGLAAGRRALTYAVHRAADVTPAALSLTLGGLQFDATTPAGTLHLHSRLVGQPNVYNILAAAATGVALGLPPAAIEDGVAALAGVPGRFEVVSHGDEEVAAVVDYAHTDDALKNLLETARKLAPRRVITVFGCGGDRDRTKRPLMGAVASRMSDVVVVTSDNPRREDPAAIINEILRGIPGGVQEERRPARGSQVLRVVDRRAAIERAIDLAEPGDLVVIAGKGHEKTQTIGERTLRFDDVDVAREALAKRRARSRIG
jgi:UDP-N-acetylmuramoyl-L-alanyl-D-glutamate--2,6-diaminopimelate ligase